MKFLLGMILVVVILILTVTYLHDRRAIPASAGTAHGRYHIPVTPELKWNP